MLERGFAILCLGDHDVAGVSRLALLDHDPIAVSDLGIDHGLTHHLENKMVLTMKKIFKIDPLGLFFGRLANFVNGELWGKPADVPWAIVFERTVPFGIPEPARHPSQLYEAGMEGIILFAVLWFAFWRTKARYQPGKLVGLFVLGYGIARFIVEFFREPDPQFHGTFIEATGIHMGQWLCVPMIAGGLYLVLTAKGRRTRVEPIAGTESVA